MKAYMTSRGIAPHFFDPGTRWKCVVDFMPHPLYWRNRPLYQLNRKLCGPQTLPGHSKEQQTLFPLPGTKAGSSSIPKPV